MPTTFRPSPQTRADTPHGAETVLDGQQPTIIRTPGDDATTVINRITRTKANANVRNLDLAA